MHPRAATFRYRFARDSAACLFIYLGYAVEHESRTTDESAYSLCIFSGLLIPCIRRVMRRTSGQDTGSAIWPPAASRCAVDTASGR